MNNHKTEESESLLKKAGSFLNNIIGDDTPDYLKSPQNINGEEVKQTSNKNMTQETIVAADIKDTDEKFEQQILNAVRQADLPGPDFLEFRESVSKLRTLNPAMSLEDCMKNTYAILSATGLTKEKIISTGDHYLEVLRSEEKDFEEAILYAQENKINTPLKEIEELKNKKEELRKQLTEIQNQIAQSDVQIELKSKEVESAKSKLSINKAKFNNTLIKVKTEIIELISLVRKTNL